MLILFIILGFWFIYYLYSIFKLNKYPSVFTGTIIFSLIGTYINYQILKSKDSLSYGIVCIISFIISIIIYSLKSKINNNYFINIKKERDQLLSEINNIVKPEVETIKVGKLTYDNTVLNPEKYICDLFNIPKSDTYINILKGEVEKLNLYLNSNEYSEIRDKVEKLNKLPRYKGIKEKYFPENFMYNTYIIYSDGRDPFIYIKSIENLNKMIKYIEKDLDKIRSATNQRKLMTPELRKQVLERDNYTCCQCGNSIYQEPNLLLEVDHIIPVSKGGITELDNLQTLCWKCNRSKSAKV